MNSNLIKKRKFIAINTLTVVFMVSIWLIDVSVSALNMGGVLTNGFSGYLDPIKAYHIGIYTAIGSFFMISLLAIE